MYAVLLVVSLLANCNSRKLGNNRNDALREIGQIRSALEEYVERHGRLPDTINPNKNLDYYEIPANNWTYYPNSDKYILVGTKVFDDENGGKYVFGLGIDLDLQCITK